MGKYKKKYIILLAFILLMVFTKGFPGQYFMNIYNDANLGMTDGFQEDLYISILNCLSILVTVIVVIKLTVKKDNNIKNKYGLLILLILLVTFIPFGSISRSGGYAGILESTVLYIWNVIPTLLNK